MVHPLGNYPVQRSRHSLEPRLCYIEIASTRRKSNSILLSEEVFREPFQLNSPFIQYAAGQSVPRSFASKSKTTSVAGVSWASFLIRLSAG